MNIFPTRRKTEDLAAALVALTVQLSDIRARVEHLETIPRAPPDVSDVRSKLDVMNDAVALLLERADQATDELNGLREAHKDLILAVSEGIERTERAERRVKATVKRARKELADRGLTDPGLEAEDAELSEIDADPSDNGGLQPLRREVAPVAPAASSIRGVSVETLQRVRGVPSWSSART